VFLVVLSSVIGSTVLLWGGLNSSQIGKTAQMLAKHLSGARSARVCQIGPDHGLDARQPWLELARAGPDPPVALVRVCVCETYIGKPFGTRVARYHSSPQMWQSH
jgi:hypothetical protein